MNSIVKTSETCAAEKLPTRELMRDHFHDLQNHLQLATMEVELAQLEASERVDCMKLLKILHALKQSLDRLRVQLFAPNESEGQAGKGN